jgi:hypothetical protein
MTNRRINEVIGIRYDDIAKIPAIITEVEAKIFDSVSLAAKPITMPPTPPKVSRPEIEKPKYCATPSTIEAIIRILIKRAIVIKYIDILPISIITWGVLRIISGIESYLLEHKDSADKDSVRLIARLIKILIIASIVLGLS